VRKTLAGTFEEKWPALAGGFQSSEPEMFLLQAAARRFVAFSFSWSECFDANIRRIV